LATVSQASSSAPGVSKLLRDRFQGLDAEVLDVGFISDPQEGAVAAEKLRQADVDLVVIFLTTYLTSNMVLPIAQRAVAPVLIIDLQPTESMVMTASTRVIGWPTVASARSQR
jgi:hypothetical protein